MQKKAPVASLAYSDAGEQLPDLLIRVRELASSVLESRLQELFANADDTLFDMAERASSHQEQNALFETMRELRLQQQNLQLQSLQRMAHGFSLLPPAADDAEIAHVAADRDNMTLLTPDELEEKVAIHNMVNRVMSCNGDLLEDLAARIGHVLGRKLALADNPLGPEHLSRQFLEAIRALGFADIQVKLILLKLFERAVLANLGELYGDCNQLLLDAGVLPQLHEHDEARRARSAASASASSTTTSSTAASVAGNAAQTLQDGADDSVKFSFQDIQTLLRSLAAAQGPATTAEDGVPISANDLMRLLNHLQQQDNQGQQLSGSEVQQQIDSILQRASQQSAKPRVLGEVASDKINLVSMLFEFILDDRNLPDSLKALIARLQIPMLKVAVMDQAFFDSASHPARRLLNELGSAALGWSSKDSRQQDKLFQKMEEVVHRLLNEFTDDPVIFAEILQEFTSFYGAERRRSELVEQRVRDAEEGRARTKQAREHIEQELNQRLLGKTLPETLVQLLQEQWSQVLLLHHLRHGEDSDEWQASLQLVDDLVWSVSQHEDPADSGRLHELVPQLVERLNSGFEDAALDPFVTAKLMSGLEVLHIQAFRNLKRMQVQPDTEASAEGTSDALPADVPTLLPEELPESLQQTALELGVQDELPEQAMVEVSEALELPDKDASNEEAEPAAEQLPEDDPAYKLVDSVRPGSWFDLKQEDGSTERCKLSIIVRSTGRYIFVNRQGLKVLDKSRTGLALAFKQEQLQMLDDALLFDRALESVISNLRQMKDC